MRLVSCSHLACGKETRVRLPWELPAEAVRTVVCAGCSQSFDRNPTAELSLLRQRPDLDGRWAIGRVAIASVAVVGALLLIQGGSSETTSQTGAGATELTDEVAASPVRTGGTSTAAGGSERTLAEPAAAARLVRQSSYSLALPAGWERLVPEGSATFTAVSAEGDADATLWVERDSTLDLAEFETRSLAQLEALAGSARVIDRVAAPTIEGTIVTLAADAPSGGPRYEVVLRAAGDYRYYLATTLQADASRAAVAGVELLQGSFTPEAGGGG